MLFYITYFPPQKHKEIVRNKTEENKRRVDYNYKINDNVLIYRDDIFRRLDGLFLGPFKVIQVYITGVGRIQRGIVTERINIDNVS